ncbi:hypothetical protein KUDE01_014675, partial [Dissostichus eleginoides]
RLRRTTLLRLRLLGIVKKRKLLLGTGGLFENFQERLYDVTDDERLYNFTDADCDDIIGNDIIGNVMHNAMTSSEGTSASDHSLASASSEGPLRSPATAHRNGAGGVEGGGVKEEWSPGGVGVWFRVWASQQDILFETFEIISHRRDTQTLIRNKTRPQFSLLKYIKVGKLLPETPCTNKMGPAFWSESQSQTWSLISGVLALLLLPALFLLMDPGGPANRDPCQPTPSV